MSYCVNCGVELEQSEAACPLCGVAVINPASPPPEKRNFPYPRRVESINSKIDRRFFAFIALVVVAIPAAVCVFYDLVSVRGLDWSLYVVGALSLALVVVLIPVSVVGHSPLFYLSLDFAASALYLALIAALLNGWSWYWPLGLPIVAICAALSLAAVYVCSLKSARGSLAKVAAALFASGVLALAVEALLDLYGNQPVFPNWSVYVFVPCALVGCAVLLLRRKYNLKDEIRRRFYF
ncbi:MAG: hypothetical protein RR998_08670 [Oscillospiraceae bacterium]